MKALSQRLARQALGNGFRYVMEETELVKLSLFPKGTDLFESRPAPVAEPSTTGKKEAFFASCVWEAVGLSTFGRRGSDYKDSIHPLINLATVEHT